MPTFTTVPVTVEAVQYVPPIAELDADGLAKGTPGNQADVEAFGVIAIHQQPWDPTTQQTCLRLFRPGTDEQFALLQPEHWLIAHADGSLSTLDPETFAEVYTEARKK